MALFLRPLKWKPAKNLRSSIAETPDPGTLRAPSAAINDTSGLDAVPNDKAMTVRTSWRHSVNRAFEAIESHGLLPSSHLKRLVVVVTADIADCHVMLQLKTVRTSTNGPLARTPLFGHLFPGRYSIMSQPGLRTGETR